MGMSFCATDMLCIMMQVIRLSSQDVPTAYAYELEAATIVQPEQVVDAVKRIAGSSRQLVAA